MQYRGLTYTDDRPALSRAERRDLRARLDLGHAAVVDAVSTLGSGAIRLRPTPLLPVAEPRFQVTHLPPWFASRQRRRSGIRHGRLTVSLGLAERLSPAELHFAAGHELGHLDQGQEPTRRELEALGWAERHVVVYDAFRAMVQHYQWQREFEADRLAVARYGADPRAAISALTKVVSMQREFGRVPDFESPQPRLTSAHPPLAERCARLARLGERIAVVGGLST